MTIPIRPYRPADREACAGIFSRAWTLAMPQMPRLVDGPAFAALTRGETILVAEGDARAVAGYVAVHPPGAFIHHLFVDPAHQNRGVGRALLAAGVTLAGGSASLKCLTANTRALAFYRRQGWREAETGADDWGPWVRFRSDGT